MGMIANETAQVASKAGIQLPYPDPLAAVEKVARQTASNISSMLQDIRRGTPTEIDAICGAIVHVGRQVAVETPINATLWHLIKALQTQTTGTITNP
jgi:2-dehydropantoate 2-reductase